MPKLSAYTLITTLAPDDVLGVWQDSTDSLKTITVGDAAEELKRLASTAFTLDEVNGNTTLTEERFVVANSGAVITLTLPNADTNEGERIYIANRGGGEVTVQAGFGDTIGGVSAITLEQYEGGTFISAGTNLWLKLSTG